MLFNEDSAVCRSERHTFSVTRCFSLSFQSEAFKQQANQISNRCTPIKLLKNKAIGGNGFKIAKRLPCSSAKRGSPRVIGGLGSPIRYRRPPCFLIQPIHQIDKGPSPKRCFLDLVPTSGSHDFIGPPTAQPDTNNRGQQAHAALMRCRADASGTSQGWMVSCDLFATVITSIHILILTVTRFFLFAVEQWAAEMNAAIPGGDGPPLPSGPLTAPSVLSFGSNPRPRIAQRHRQPTPSAPNTVHRAPAHCTDCNEPRQQQPAIPVDALNAFQLAQHAPIDGHLAANPHPPSSDSTEQELQSWLKAVAELPHCLNPLRTRVPPTENAYLLSTTASSLIVS